MTNSPAPLLRSAIALAVIFGLLALLPEGGPALRYRHEALATGEYWRLFSAHFVHLNPAHALLNATGTLLLAAVFFREISPRQWWAVVLVAPVLISLGMWMRQSPFTSYAGFSGVLHALLYLGVIRLLATAPWLAGSVLLLLVARQAWEQTAAYDPAYLQGVIGGRVMPDAHLFGAVTGTVAGAWSLWRDRLHTGRATGYSPGTGPDA